MPINQNRVDILLAAFNGEKYLERQLSSIFQQTHQDIHIIIRDDHSTDSTAEIIKKWAILYPAKMTILPSLENLGVIGNFSKLMEHARAQYIMFADGDDIWQPKK